MAVGTDNDWEHFGRTDPYWAVLTEDRYRGGQLDQHGLTEFFRSGHEHVSRVLALIHRHLDPEFTPVRALDFGCGVGRLSLALARISQSVIGVDVAPAMLQEGRANAARQGVANVQFILGSDSLVELTTPFDFVLSHIVLQHVPCDRGQRIFERLVSLVDAGGAGALHVTYSKARFGAGLFSAWPSSAPSFSPSPIRELVQFAGAAARALARRRRSWQQRLRGRPRMQMNPYILNPLFHVLQRAGVRSLHIELTDHGGEYGAMILFQRPA